jgi:hypothetical protein
VHEGGVHHGDIRVHPEGVPEGTEGRPSGGPAAGAPQRLKSFSSPVVRVRKFWGEFF